MLHDFPNVYELTFSLQVETGSEDTVRGIQYMATAAVCEASRPEIRLRSIPDTAPVISDIEQVSIQSHRVIVKL